MTIVSRERNMIIVPLTVEKGIVFEVEEAWDLAGDIRQAENNIRILEKRGRESQRGALRWWRERLKQLRMVAEREI